MDRRLLTVVLMAVFVALVITAIFYQITKGRRTVQTEVPTRELVVAKENLPIGSVSPRRMSGSSISRSRLIRRKRSAASKM